MNSTNEQLVRIVQNHEYQSNEHIMFFDAVLLK